MSQRSEHLTDDALAQFLRSRSADPDLGLLDDIVRTVVATPQDRPWLRLRPVRLPRTSLLIVASALLLATMGAIAVGTRFLVPDPLVSAFGGTWISTSDADGGTQTMSVEVSADGAVDVTVHDTIATVCSGASSTMTGSGAIEGGTRIVIPQPVYTCDDGSEPATLSGPPLEVQLRNWTLTRDSQAGTLTDNIGGVWHREGAAVPEPSPEPAISDRMWPQSSLDEVREAQQLADAGDPDYTWQVDAGLASDDEAELELLANGQVEIVDRFMREELGWDAYALNPFEGMARNGVYDVFYDMRFLRCAPDRTNPLYLNEPGAQQPGASCSPTVDDFTYESVSLNLVQPERQGAGGIWVVSNWRPAAPFTQADPVAVAAQATDRLEEFLAARIAGAGAEALVQVDAQADVPLLYGTTSGAPYARSEIQVMEAPQWPDGRMTFSARLFADDDTVVEQELSWRPGEGLWLHANTTTENGQAVAVTYTSADGQAAVSAPSPWTMWWPEESHVVDLDVWFGLMERGSHESETSIGFVDPVSYDAWCARQGGSPLLSAPAGAAAIAQQVIADPNFETTAPVAARIGGLDAVSIDVSLAPGGKSCGIGMIVISRWIHELWDPSLRLRLYLVDLPEGMSVETLAITVVAPADRFEEVIAETKPIIESIQFHPG